MIKITSAKEYNGKITITKNSLLVLEAWNYSSSGQPICIERFKIPAESLPFGMRRLENTRDMQDMEFYFVTNDALKEDDLEVVRIPFDEDGFAGAFVPLNDFLKYWR